MIAPEHPLRKTTLRGPSKTSAKSTTALPMVATTLKGKTAVLLEMTVILSPLKTKTEALAP